MKNVLPPLLTAIITVAGALLGYSYEKGLERQVDIRKTQQEIYSCLINNIAERNRLLGLFEQSAEYTKADPRDQPQLEQRHQLTDPALAKNYNDRIAIISSLCLYGTDAAIDAYVKYAADNARRVGGDLGALVLGLRASVYGASVYGRTRLKASNPRDVKDTNLAIFNDPKFLQ